jgi:hypothetical protein
MFKIHIYVKRGQIRKVEIVNGGNFSIKLDPSYIIMKDNKPYALYSPISGLTIRLLPEITEYHYR